MDNQALLDIITIAKGISLPAAVLLCTYIIFKSPLITALADKIRSTIRINGDAGILNEVKTQLEEAHLLASNHTSGLPEMQKTLDRMEVLMRGMNDKLDLTNSGISYIKGRLNGKSADI